LCPCSFFVCLCLCLLLRLCLFCLGSFCVRASNCVCLCLCLFVIVFVCVRSCVRKCVGVRLCCVYVLFLSVVIVFCVCVGR